MMGDGKWMDKTELKWLLVKNGGIPYTQASGRIDHMLAVKLIEERLVKTKTKPRREVRLVRMVTDDEE